MVLISHGSGVSDALTNAFRIQDLELEKCKGTI